LKPKEVDEMEWEDVAILTAIASGRNKRDAKGN